MLHSRVEGIGNWPKSLDLGGDEICNHVDGQLQFTPSEMLPIVEPRMRADCDAMILCQTNGVPHRGRITRMRAARDVRGCDAPHECGVLSASFADIGVQIDVHAMYANTLVILATFLQGWKPDNRRFSEENGAAHPLRYD